MHVHEPYYIVVYGLSGYTIFFYIINSMVFFLGGGGRAGNMEHKMNFDFLCNFCPEHFSV
jgi:hypothetical protein